MTIPVSPLLTFLLAPQLILHYHWITEFYLSTRTFLPTCLPAFLPTCLPAFLPTYLPWVTTYSPTYPITYQLTLVLDYLVQRTIRCNATNAMQWKTIYIYIHIYIYILYILSIQCTCIYIYVIYHMYLILHIFSLFNLEAAQLEVSQIDRFGDGAVGGCHFEPKQVAHRVPRFSWSGHPSKYLIHDTIHLPYSISIFICPIQYH